MPAELGARLRRARRARGLGLRPLGARTGASHPHLAAIERGRRAPGAGVAEAVEDARERRAAERQGNADGASDPCAPPAMRARARRSDARL